MNTYYTNADGTKTDQVNVIMPSGIYRQIGTGDDQLPPSNESEMTYKEGMTLHGFYGDDQLKDLIDWHLFGNIITASVSYKKNNDSDEKNQPASSQLFFPFYGTNDSTITTPPLYYRSMTDYKGNYHKWSPWRRIAYYDEIEAVVIRILKSKGLIT